MVTSILTGVAAVTGTGLVISLLLRHARSRLPDDENAIVDAIDRVLPQTQCAQCGYPGCRPYAEAVAGGEAINRCPPGGEQTIVVLADLLGREAIPLDTECGESKGEIRAVIREDECIGCTLCIQACPVDAIVGAAQKMHTVIESECTGCELCLPPCPVDCIDLVSIKKDEPVIEPGEAANECIRCGYCEPACPRDLAPQDLYWYRNADDELAALNLDSCVECRLCDRVCPSEIPLTAHFQAAKRRIRQREDEAGRAIIARERFDAREARMARSQATVKQRPSRAEKSALLEAIKRETS